MNSTRILTLAAAAAVSASAFAQGVFNYNDRDIIAVFTKSGGPDVAINLGTPESFDTQNSVNFSSTAGFVKYNATTQLLDIYGGSLSGVSFTIFGSQKNSAATDSVSTVQRSSWLSLAETTPGTVNGPIVGFGSTAAASLNANVNSAVGYPGGTSGFKQIASGNAVDAVSNNGTVLVTQQSDALYSAYGFSSKNQPGNPQKLGIYASIPGGGTQLQNAAGGTSDFFQFQPGAANGGKGTASFLGTFNLDQNTGALNFTAVPEPSDYAAIAGGVLLAGAVLRRRFQKR